MSSAFSYHVDVLGRDPKSAKKWLELDSSELVALGSLYAQRTERAVLG